MKKSAIYILLTLLTFSCRTIEDEDYFFGNINYINKEYERIELKGDSISLDGYTTLYFSVYDSLMIFWNSRMPESTTFSISGIKTGKHYGNYVMQGRGPHESSTAPIFQFYQKDNDLMALLTAPNEDELREWNISKSIESGYTVYDTIFPYAWRMEHPSAYLNIYRMSENNLLVKVSKRHSVENSKIQAWPRYQIRSIIENKLVREYEIFKQDLYIGNPDVLLMWPFSSNDCIKPDNKKIAQGMVSLSQINIIDLETGDVSYYRATDSPTLSMIAEEKKLLKSPLFYHRCQCNDKYIYALYSGSPREDRYGNAILPSKIHQFDWDGNLIHEIILSEPATQIWLDSNSNFMYTYNEMNENIWRYDINELDI
jgi:hypothetical protein